MLAIFGASLMRGLACGQPLPAFPGADGAAMNVSGGRDLGSGQIVYHVTRLNTAIDDPDRFDFGTLRYGLNNNNFPAGVPRTIVFDVGGVFHLGRLDQPGEDPPWITNGNAWDAQSRLTIGGSNITFAGQTAPGAGVIFMGGGLKPQGDNNILRNITVASGYGLRNWWSPGDPFPEDPAPNPTSPGIGIFPDGNVFDGLDIAGTNLMIDHVSTLYATDETISMNEVSDNVTVQYSNISQGQNYPDWDGGFTGHAYGSLLEAGPDAAISFHHNLYAHQKGRVPQTQGNAAYYDFRNNVFYNWFGTAGNINSPTRANLVGNFYLTGNGGDDPVGGDSTEIEYRNGGTSVVSGGSRVYREGNLLDTNRDGDPDDGALVSGGASNTLWSGGVDTYAGATDNARDAFDRVLDYVGANWQRRNNVIDTPDERIIDETRTGTGKIVAWADDPWNNDPNEGVEWRNLVNTPQTNRETDWDSETDIGYGVGDGMPTHWELKHGLDPGARDDADDFDSDGYTNLEEYLNEIAAWPAPGAIIFNNAHGDGRFEHILNWDANPDAGSVHPWQPSRYDTAVINNGLVTVDSVGQHAGNLLLGTSHGDNATLNVTSGWLEVEDATHGMSDGVTVIGDHPQAESTLNLTGGTLLTGTLLKGEAGAFSFTGGTLMADLVDFDLQVDGGSLSPGAVTNELMVSGDLTLASGEVELILTSGAVFSRIDATGAALLGGDLIVGLDEAFTPNASDIFQVLTADFISGAFANVSGGRVPVVGGGSFLVTIESQALLLSDFLAGLPGDFNFDGSVDAADYAVWRNGLGTIYTIDQYSDWRTHFGDSLASSSEASPAPEPTTGGLLGAFAVLSLVTRPCTGCFRYRDFAR